MAWRDKALLVVIQIWVLACAAAFGRDLNNNSTSDVWEERYGVGLIQAEADPDGDGFTNLDESQLGTDPFDPNSRVALELKAGAAGELALHVCLAPGKRFQIESSSDLVSWQPLGPVFVPAQAESEFSLGPVTGNRKFYRCVFIGDVDEDGDGLNAWEETLLGYRDDDADNNGLPDAWELQFFGHTGVDPAADADEDGVSNVLEFVGQTVPVPSGPLITLEYPADAVPVR